MACKMLQLFISVVLIAFSSLVAGESCSSPKVDSRVYTTSDAQMSSETVVIVEFSLQCSNNVPKDINVHAEFNGRTSPVTKIVDTDKYQVSFNSEHKKLPSGTYKVRFFDEDLFGEFRKAQRSGEDTSSLKTLFTVDVNHQGASQGLWVQTEHIATAIATLVCYLAYSARSRLQS